MLRNERRQFKEEKLAEQLKQAEELSGRKMHYVYFHMEMSMARDHSTLSTLKFSLPSHLRQYKVLAHSQERELTQLKEKLWEGRDAAHSLNEHVQALLTPDEPDKSLGQDLQEQLAEGCRLAQQLVQKLSPENDEDVQVEEAEKVQKSSPPREMQKAEKKEVPEDSLEECAITCSNSHGPYDSNQPHRKTKFIFEEDKVDSTLIGSSSHVEWEDAVDIIPENESDDEEEEEKGPVSPRLSRELLDEKGPEVLQDSLDRCYSTPSSCLEQPDSCQAYGSSFYALEEKHVGLSLDVGEIEKKGKGKKRRGRRSKKKRRRGRKEGEEDQNPPCPRLNGVLMEVEEPEVLQDSLDRCYSTPSMYFELPDSFQHYRSVFYSFEEQHISFALYVDNRFFTLTALMDLSFFFSKHFLMLLLKSSGALWCLIFPGCFFSFVSFSRLNGVLMEVEEPEVLQDSLDRCYSTPSMYFELPDSFQHYRSVFYSFEEQHISFALYVDNRLNGMLMEVEEPEVLQDSLDRCYSTPSGCLELTDSCQPYRSAFYVLEQQRVGLAVDMDEIEKYQEVEEDQDPSCPRLSRELLDEKGPEVLQDSLDRCYSTPSGYLELPDLGQPYSSAVYSLEEQYLGLALDVDRIKNDQEEEEDQGPPCPRLSRELLEVVEPEVLQDSLDRCYSTPSSCLEQPDSCQAYGSSFYALEEKHVGFSLDVGEIEKTGKGKKRRGRRSKKKRRRGGKEGEEDQNPPCPRLNGMLMEVEEPEVLQDSLDRCYSTPSMYFELPDSFQHYRSVFYSFEEQHLSFALYVDNRLNGVLMEVEEPEVLQDSLDRCYSTPSGCLELTDSCQPYRSAFYVLEQQRVGLAVDMDEIEKYQEVEEDQDPSCPRLSRELLDEKGPEVLQDSLDRCYSTPSGYLELPDLGQPYSSAVYSLEEQYLGLALDVDRIKNDQEEEEDQGPPCPRLSRELLEVVEPEVLQDSLDRCYSTPSSCLEQPDSCQAYGSSFYALEEKHVGFSLDVGEIEKTGKGKKRRGRRSKKKRRRGGKEGEEDQNPPCPRLNGVLMEVEEPEVLQDSLDRCYSTPSMYFELPDSFQHYRSVFYSFEEQHISFTLYVDNRFFTLTVTSLHLVFQMEVIFPQ
ncbi:neuroblastoma breakpoint family member 14 [Pan troglodytes]|uniref:neuroblastoma breakpoint family member 14 n=1 Tax=Pan troglodytes TaxID=9598 RepID=UPI00301353A1